MHLQQDIKSVNSKDEQKSTVKFQRKILNDLSVLTARLLRKVLLVTVKNLPEFSNISFRMIAETSPAATSFVL